MHVSIERNRKQYPDAGSLRIKILTLLLIGLAFVYNLILLYQIIRKPVIPAGKRVDCIDRYLLLQYLSM